MNAVEYAHKQGLMLYMPTQSADLTMLQWFLTLRDNGTFFEVFEPSLGTLSNFVKFLQFPNNMLYYSHDNELSYAFWTVPTGQRKAIMGFWSGPEMPKAKTFRLLRASHAYAFSFYTLLLGFTRNENLLSYINRLGYNTVGRLPHGWDGEEDATLVSLTVEDFQTSKLMPAMYATRNPQEKTVRIGGD
jgi:hypothetical protein